jgi:putative oxidoreductase
MKRIFNSGIHLNTLHFWLFIFRIAVCLLMLTHGWPKLESLISGNIRFMDPFGIGMKTSLALTIFAEVVCSILIILGLATRLATIPLVINMSVAVFMAHANDPLAKKELPILFLLCYVTLLVTGAGKYSLDGLLGERKRR